MSYTVHDIANKIVIRQTDLEKGDVITNLKLQKLLYYVQGYHLAFFNKPMFQEGLEAWMYGPVVPEVYHLHKEKGKMAIVLDSSIKEIDLPPEVEDMFGQVMKEYGKFSAIRLMEMTHQEKPWIESFQNPIDKRIDIATMKTFFTSLVDE